MSGLSKPQVEAFRRDGMLFPIPVYALDETADFMRRLESLEAARAGRLPPSLNAKPHLLLPWLWELVHDPRILDPVEDLIGPDILCWGTSFISKRPNDSRYVAWHQDATYWGLSSPEAVTAWVAFTPSTRENGCVRMLPGTHRQQLPHVNSRDAANQLGLQERLAVDIDETRAVNVVLAPGEMSLHDVLIVHGSDANRSGVRRVGFAIRYIPGHVRQVVGARNLATLVRGRDHGNFELEQAPIAEFDPTAMRRHAESLRRGMDVLFSAAKQDRG